MAISHLQDIHNTIMFTFGSSTSKTFLKSDSEWNQVYLLTHSLKNSRLAIQGDFALYLSSSDCSEQGSNYESLVPGGDTFQKWHLFNIFLYSNKFTNMFAALVAPDMISPPEVIHTLALKKSENGGTCLFPPAACHSLALPPSPHQLSGSAYGKRNAPLFRTGVSKFFSRRATSSH